MLNGYIYYSNTYLLNIFSVKLFFLDKYSIYFYSINLYISLSNPYLVASASTFAFSYSSISVSRHVNPRLAYVTSFVV